VDAPHRINWSRESLAVPRREDTPHRSSPLSTPRPPVAAPGAPALRPRRSGGCTSEAGTGAGRRLTPPVTQAGGGRGVADAIPGITIALGPPFGATLRGDASAIAAARPDEIMRAFLHSCDGRWVRTSRLLWLQLANEETTLRMRE